MVLGPATIRFSMIWYVSRGKLLGESISLTWFGTISLEAWLLLAQKSTPCDWSLVWQVDDIRSYCMIWFAFFDCLRKIVPYCVPFIFYRIFHIVCAKIGFVNFCRWSCVVWVNFIIELKIIVECHWKHIWKIFKHKQCCHLSVNTVKRQNLYSFK